MFQLLLVLLVSSAFSQVSLETKKKVESEIARINSMREGMVSGAQSGVTKDTFRALCGPVGISLKQLADKEGWIIRQSSEKYRNSKNKANPIEQKAIAVFQKQPQKKDYWQETKKGSHYFRRLDVQPACLACHGSKDTRPDFIKRDYPKDLAYDFKVGDLRGIYSVFVANDKKTNSKGH